MPFAKTISIPKRAVRGRSVSGIRKRKSDSLSQLNAMMWKLNLDELLSVSEYLDRAAHGEQPLSLPDSLGARQCAEVIAGLRTPDARLKAIRMLNKQIVSKNRAGVDAASARKAYRNFMDAE